MSGEKKKKKLDPRAAAAASPNSGSKREFSGQRRAGDAINERPSAPDGRARPAIAARASAADRGARDRQPLPGPRVTFRGLAA